MSTKSAHGLRAPIRVALVGIGARLPGKVVSALRNVVGHVELGANLKAAGAVGHPEIVQDDFGVFEVARQRVTGTRPLYLEFGVFEGRSMRWWSENLPQSEARFFGFDSFEGLPENWQSGFPAGTFKTGQPPEIADDRITFVTGWFDETLPKFEVPDHDQLIVNIDCDLYSSATTVLTWIEPYVQPGTLIYFDEFPSPDHEMRAFKEFLVRSRRAAEPCAVSRNSYHWLFEVV